jgi:large subunit ribosomal protein L6
MWGLFRQRVANDVKGLSEGFLIVIKIVGGGYKAAVSADGCSMTLSLGYSHELSLRVPEGVKVTCIKNAIIELRGADKRVLGDFAAALQLLRPADPYKQKGVIPQGAFVRKKKGKAN